MMRLAFFTVAIALGACGGTTTDNVLPIEGSYDLSVSVVNVVPSSQPGSLPSGLQPVAPGQHARLDIHKVANGSYEGAITTDFRDPVVATVTIANDKLTVQPGASFGGPASVGYGTVSDSFDTIVFDLNGGQLSGSWIGTGSETLSLGDYGMFGAMSGTGTLIHDLRAPTSQVSAFAASHSPAALPWESIFVHVSEPVEPETLTASLSGNAGNLSVHWVPSAPSPDWEGVTSMTGLRSEWGSPGADLSLTVAAGALDPSGNASVVSASPITFMDVPMRSSFDASHAPAQWGQVNVVSGTDACGTAASCFEIGPITGPCVVDAGGAGIAGRLSGPGANVTITYRVRAQAELNPPSNESITLSLAIPGQAAQDQSLAMTFATTADPSYPSATDWVTTSFPVPAGANGEVGFSFVPFRSNSYCGGGPALPPVTLLVDVVSLVME